MVNRSCDMPRTKRHTAAGYRLRCGTVGFDGDSAWVVSRTAAGAAYFASGAVSVRSTPFLPQRNLNLAKSNQRLWEQR